jgi:hypothetical protein
VIAPKGAHWDLYQIPRGRRQRQCLKKVVIFFFSLLITLFDVLLSCF